MLVYVVPAVLSLGLVVAIALGAKSPDVERSNLADAQLLQYQVFLYTADQFFKATAPPLANTAYDWTAIKGSATSTMKESGIPPHWKAIRKIDGTWVACTEMTETTLAKLPKLFPTQAQPAQTIQASAILSIVGGGGASPANVNAAYVTVGHSALDAPVAANLCSGT